MATVLSVNVGQVRAIQVSDRVITTAIWKDPVDGRIPLAGVNFAGDDQADRTVHGGPDKAVYAYASEDTAWWERELGRALGPGTFGENLTVRGVDLTNARIGERWAVGSAILEVRQPRLPCFKLALRMDDPLFVKRFAAAGRPGAYFGILQEGDVGAGDEMELIERPDHDVTVGLIAHVYLREHHRAGELLVAPALPAGWRDWVLGRAA
jgi:MOSC domain-containing protein YiiM